MRKSPFVIYGFSGTFLHLKTKKSPNFRAFSSCHLFCMTMMGWEMGFEPTIFGTTIRRFNQLSYTHHICIPKGMIFGAPYWIRTSGLLLRRQLLYPAELKAQLGAGDGNRTHVTSLEGWNSTLELHPLLLCCVLLSYFICPSQRYLLYHTFFHLSTHFSKKFLVFLLFV